MPLLITPAQPLLTSAEIPVAQAYAIIDDVSYTRRGLTPKTVVCQVGYYANEAASVSETASPLRLQLLPTSLSLPLTPEQANEVPIFQALEQALTQQLLSLLGEGTTIDPVP